MIACSKTKIDGLDLLRRFVKKIRRQGECWVWIGAANSKGYPQLRVGISTLYAHRISYELFVGPIPGGHQVHHQCLNSMCVNPAHLKCLTAEQNRFLQTVGSGSVDDLPF